MYDFLDDIIHPGSLVFDIGANVGGMTNTYLNLGARVIAVEPIAEFADRLHTTYPAATVVQKAVGSHYEKSVPIHVSGTLTTMVPDLWWTGRFSHISAARTETTEMITLSMLIEEYGTPDYIKIDCEGYDLEVVRGLDSPVPALSFEYIQEHFSRAFESVILLQRLGMTRFNLMWGGMHPYLTKYVDYDALHAALKDARYQMWGDLVALA